MAGKLSREDILKIAKLAKLELSEEQIEKFQVELGEILEYVEKLQSVNTDNLIPTNQVTGLTNVWREDVVIDYGYDASKLLENVPEKEGDLIKVKRIIE